MKVPMQMKRFQVVYRFYWAICILLFTTSLLGCQFINGIEKEKPIPAQLSVKEAPYSEIGESKIIESPIGAYREVGNNRFDRVAYLFETKHIGDLIKLTLTIPDDKVRSAEVFLISEYLNTKDQYGHAVNVLGSGYLTGRSWPISGKMITQSFYFHVPLSRKFAIVIMTSEKGAPAAFGALKLEKLGLTEGIAQLPYETRLPNCRKLGNYWEDPILASSFGAMYPATPETFQKSLDRSVAYFYRIGQNTLIYPVVWYMASLYQPSAEFAKVWYNRRHPADYDKMMAKTYSKAGIEFWPSIRNWTLPSLKSLMKSPEDIRSGKVNDYVNAVTSDGQVRIIDKRQWHKPPQVNAFHPRVRKAMKNLVSEIMDRIGDEPSVPGIALFNTVHSCHGLGTIDQSYDDYTLKLFSQETGIQLPLPPLKPEERFHAWYTWLKNEHWDEWIQWRKEKQTEIFYELAGIVAAKKPGAKLQVMVKYPIPTLYVGETVNDVNAYLNEIGIDLEALARNEDIIISRMSRASEYQRMLRTAQEDSPKVKRLFNRGKLNFSKDWQQPFIGKTDGSVIQYCYFEANFKKMNLPMLRFPENWRNGEMSWHVTPPKGAGRNSLEYIAKSVGLYDALFVAHGGFNLGAQGMEDVLQPFAAVFTSLPAKHFKTVYDKDGVVLRSLVSEGKRWTYLVNASAYPQKISIEFVGKGKLQQLGLISEIQKVSSSGIVTLTIKPYDIAAWKGATGLEPVSACVHKQEDKVMTSQSGPNVLVILSDQWRASAFSYRGNPDVKTPNIDKLAAEGVEFTNAVSGIPVCSPFRATLMTGQRPLTNGVFMNDVLLDTNAVSLAKVMAKAGYQTAYIGKWHLNGHGRSSFIPEGNRRQGFQYWKVLECTHNYNHSIYYAETPDTLIWEGYDAIAQTKDAQKYIMEYANEEKPFVLFLSWGPPHAPYHTAPQKYKDLYDPAKIQLRPNVPVDLQEKVKKDLSGYYAHCTALDDMVGLLRQTLQETGLDDNTII